jgi:hypothetical protein
MQPGVESKLGGSEREMIVEEGTARDFCVYYVLRGAIVITNIHVHAMIGVGVEPERKVTYSIRDVYSSS